MFLPMTAVIISAVNSNLIWYIIVYLEASNVLCMPCYVLVMKLTTVHLLFVTKNASFGITKPS